MPAASFIRHRLSLVQSVDLKTRRDVIKTRALLGFCRVVKVGDRLAGTGLPRDRATCIRRRKLINKWWPLCCVISGPSVDVVLLSELANDAEI